MAGTDAAMTTHQPPGQSRTVLAFDVEAAGIFDLRSLHALENVRREAGDPISDWQRAVAAGEYPSSWRARAWIESRGAKGLIDPSRRAPGLWHLVLFSWNVPEAATVAPSSGSRSAEF